MIRIDTGDSLTDGMLRALAQKLALADNADIEVCSPESAESSSKAVKIIVCTDAEAAELEKSCPDGAYALTRPVSFSEFTDIVTSARALPRTAECGFSFDRESGVVTRGEKSVQLTVRESELFAYLLAHRRRPVSRERLKAALWPSSGDTNAPDVYISYLRRKLRVLFGDGVIANERGVGYMLKNIQYMDEV